MLLYTHYLISPYEYVPFQKIDPQLELIHYKAYRAYKATFIFAYWPMCHVSLYFFLGGVVGIDAECSPAGGYAGSLEGGPEVETCAGRVLKNLHRNLRRVNGEFSGLYCSSKPRIWATFIGTYENAAVLQNTSAFLLPRRFAGCVEGSRTCRLCFLQGKEFSRKDSCHCFFGTGKLLGNRTERPFKKGRFPSPLQWKIGWSWKHVEDPHVFNHQSVQGLQDIPSGTAGVSPQSKVFKAQGHVHCILAGMNGGGSVEICFC